MLLRYIIESIKIILIRREKDKKILIRVFLSDKVIFLLKTTFDKRSKVKKLLFFDFCSINKEEAGRK